MRHAHRDSLRGQNPGFPAGKLQLYGPWTVVEGLLLLVNTQAHSSQNIPRLSDLGHLWTLLQVQLHSNDQLKLSQAKIPRSGCCANQANVNWHGYNKSFSFFSRVVSSWNPWKMMDFVRLDHHSIIPTSKGKLFQPCWPCSTPPASTGDVWILPEKIHQNRHLDRVYPT